MFKYSFYIKNTAFLNYQLFGILSNKKETFICLDTVIVLLAFPLINFGIELNKNKAIMKAARD